jgi:hypothetical protein
MIEGVTSKAELESLIQDASTKAFKEVLLSYGIDHRDPIELQKDFAYIRALRNTADATKRKAWMVVISVVVTGAIAVIWQALRS